MEKQKPAGGSSIELRQSVKIEMKDRFEMFKITLRTDMALGKFPSGVLKLLM